MIQQVAASANSTSEEFDENAVKDNSVFGLSGDIQQPEKEQKADEETFDGDFDMSDFVDLTAEDEAQIMGRLMRRFKFT